MAASTTMDVQCPQCRTEYEFERSRVGPEGLPVKCSQCQHVFKVFANHDEPAWKVRQANGNMFEFRELTTLQRWIVEQKVSRDDQISKTGRNWKRLGDIAELASFFQVVEKAKAPTRPRTNTDPSLLPAAFPGGGPQQAVAPSRAQPSVPPPAPAEATGWNLDDLDPPTKAAFVISDQGISANHALPEPQQPRRTSRPAPRQQPPQHFDDESSAGWDEPAPPGGKGKWIALGVVSLLAALATVHLLRPDLLASLLGSQVPELALSHLSSGYEALNRDTETSIAAAVDNFEKAIALAPEHAAAKAALAEALLTHAENDVALAALLSVTVKDKEPSAEDKAKAQTLREDAQRDAERAFNVAKEALVIDPSGMQANRALADYYRFKGAKQQMTSLLERARQQAPNDARLAYVTGSASLGEKTSAGIAAQHFQRALEIDPTLLRARYKLALAHRLQDETQQAIAQLEKVLSEEPEHQRAKLLLDKLRPPAPEPAPEKEAVKEPQGPVSAERLIAQADRMRQRDQSRAAMRLYEQAIEMEPENVDALNGLGWCYFDVGQTDAAIATFKRALRLVPRFSDAHMGIATAYEEKKMKRDAVKHYRLYLEIFPGGPEAGVAREAIKRLE